MKKIASFEVDHTRLEPGLYISRTDGDIVTYDLRFIRPNTPPFLSCAAIHTIEHIFATFLRNSKLGEGIIYFGPMGCRTGFYLLTRGLSEDEVIRLVQSAAEFTASFTADIPGITAEECGNYLEHDMPAAREAAAEYARVISRWKKSSLKYNSK